MINYPFHRPACLLCCLGFLLIFSCNNQPAWITQVDEYNSQWKSRLEKGYAIQKLHIDSSGNTWAISSDGPVFFRPKDSSGWRQENLPGANYELRDINGINDDVYVAGDSGVILHKQKGQPWTRHQGLPVTSNLRFIYVYENDIWILGEKGTSLHKSKDGPWVKEACPDNEASLYCMSGRPGNLCISGSRSLLLRQSAGGQWTKEYTPVEDLELENIFVAGTDMWAGAKDGTVLHNKNNEGWMKEVLPVSGHEITGIYGWDDQMWVVFFNGIILYKNGNKPWVKEVDRSLETSLYFINMHGREREIWVVGTYGIALHKQNNNPWKTEDSKSKGLPLFDITANNDIVVAGGFYETIVVKKRNKPWMREKAMISETPFRGIFAQDDEIWISCDSFLLHKKGEGAWQKELTGLSYFELETGYKYGDQVWLVGNPGIILHKTSRDGWLHKTPSLSKNYTRLHAICGIKDNLWVVGSHGTIMHKKSGEQQWTKENTGTTPSHFVSIYLQGDHLYVAGGMPVVIVHKKINEQFWVQEELDISRIKNPNMHLSHINGYGDEIWATGFPGLVFHKKGNQAWVQEDIDEPDYHLDRVLQSGDNITIIGNTAQSGKILYKTGKEKWQQEKLDNCTLHDVIRYNNGSLVISNLGISYKKDGQHDFMHVKQLLNNRKITGAAMANGKLYCINEYEIAAVTPEKHHYPLVDKMRYLYEDFKNKDSVEVQIVVSIFPEHKKSLDNLQIVFEAQSHNGNQQGREHYKPVTANVTLIDSSAYTRTYATRFEIAKNFRIEPSSDITNKLNMRVHMTSAPQHIDKYTVLKDKNGHAYLTIDDKWKIDSPIEVAGIAIAVYYILSLACCWLAPMRFYKIYQSEFITGISSGKYPFNHIIVKAGGLLLNRLVYTDHVMDAWMHARYKGVKAIFEKNETVQARKQYNPLPIDVETAASTEQIEKPDEFLLDELFNKKRSVVQILGQGGAGKTTLAITLGRWLLNPATQKKLKIVAAPLIVDADDDGLVQTVTRMLKARFPKDPLSQQFVGMLLKKKRIVVIMDALSERTASPEKYLVKTLSETPLNALIITSRYRIPIPVKDGTNIDMLSLNSGNLLPFITACFDFYQDHPLKKGHEQYAFAEKIVQLVEENNPDTYITPLFVKLVIDNALANVTNNTTAEEVINSIPEFIILVYYDYLVRVNPILPAAKNYMEHAQMIDVAEIIAQLSVQKDLIPREVSEEEVRSRLADLHNDIDPIERLIDNGIITRRPSINVNYLRFDMDTLAEYIGANRLYSVCKSDPQLLNDLLTRINEAGDKAKTFKIAMEQVIRYHTKQRS